MKISLKGMNNAVHFLEGHVAHDDQNTVALAKECNRQAEKLHYTLLDVSRSNLWSIIGSLLFRLEGARNEWFTRQKLEKETSRHGV